MKKFTKIKKIITALIVSVAVFFSGQGSLSATFFNARAEEINDLSQIPITYDLEGLDLTKYPKNANADPAVFMFTEYCYSEDSKFDNIYGLYVYLYNPNEQLIDINNVSVSMAIEYTDTGKPSQYANCKLAYIDKTDNNRFYKFRVSRSSKFLSLEQSYNKTHSKRRYDIVGFQLKYDVGGWVNTTDFFTEQTLIYTGYAKGCDETSMAESTLSCNSESLKVLKPTVGHTNYRFNNLNTNGEYDLRDDLNSVFFTVPKDVIDKYGEINQLSAEWYEFKTTPIFVTSDSGVHDGFINSGYLHKDIGVKDSNLKYRVFWEENLNISAAKTYFSKDYNGASESISGTGFDYSYSGVGNGNTLTRMDWIFLRENVDSVDDYYLPREDIEQYMKDHTDSTATNLICGYNPYFFEKSIDEDRTKLLVRQNNGENKRGLIKQDLSSTQIETFLQKDKNTVWNNILNSLGPLGSIFNNFLSNNKVEAIEYLPIVKVPVTDLYLSKEGFCNKYYVNPVDYEIKNCNHDDCSIGDCLRDIKSQLELAKKNGDSFYLFRFAITDYYASTARFDMIGDNSMSSQDGYVAQETVFLDFDVIDLHFQNQDELTVIGVVSDPFDIINGLDPPENLKVKTDWWMKILALVSLVLLIVIICPFISPILTIAFNLLGKLIGVLLKALGLIFKFIWSILTFPFRLLKPK